MMDRGDTSGMTWRRSAARLALFAMLFQAMLTALPMPAGAAAGQSAVTGIPFSTILICTVQGLQRISFDENGRPTGTQEPVSASETCPICTVLSASAAIIPDMAVAPLRALKAVDVCHSGAATRPTGASLLARPGRGPPLSL